MIATETLCEVLSGKRRHGKHPASPRRGSDLGDKFRLTRSQFIIGSAAAIAGAVIGLPRPWERFMPSDEQLKETWQKISPKERIKRLEFKQYPRFSDFDSTQEMILASAQYFCSVTGCFAENLTNKVIFADAERIIEEIEVDNGRKLTAEEREKYGRGVVEMVGSKRGFILINEANLRKETNKFIQQPDAAGELEGRDAFNVMLKSTIFHAYTHTIVNKEGFPFEQIIIQGQVPVAYDKLDEGFTFFGKRADGIKVAIGGGDEAITDYIGTAIAQDTGPYVSGSGYTSGVKLIEMLNLKAKITVADFIGYYTGKKPKRELFRRWGALKNPANPNEQAALAALLIIGIRVDYPQDITQEQAVVKINTLLKP